MPDLSPDTLIGRSLDDTDVRDLLRDIDATPEAFEDADDHYWLSRPSGLGVCATGDDRRINTVWLYAEGMSRCRAYVGELPRGLKFGWDRAKAVSILGEPDRIQPDSERWVGEDCDLLLEYDDNSVIKRVTLTTV